jgi:hypothetical protein
MDFLLLSFDEYWWVQKATLISRASQPLLW